MKKSKLQTFIQIAGTLISGGVFVWLLSKQDWQQVLHSLENIPGWAILASFAFVLAGQLANSLRWYVLLRAQRIPIGIRETVRIVFSGAFASNFLPTTIGGDVLRVVSLFRFSSSRLVAFGSVVLDRLLNVIAMLSFLPLSWFVFDVPGLLAPTSWQPGKLFSLMWIGEKWTGKIQALWHKFIRPIRAAIREWSRQPLSLLLALVISWISLIVVFIGVWIIATHIGIPVALYQVAAISALVYLVTLLPISINGYGLREVAVTALYIQVGATLEQASTLALLTRVLSLLATMPGVLWVSQTLAIQKQADLDGAGYPANGED